MSYGNRILVALDQLINALIGGWPDETLSANAHRMRAKKQPYWGWLAGFIDTLFFWQKDHCFKAHMAERERRQLPDEYRGLQ